MSRTVVVTGKIGPLFGTQACWRATRYYHEIYSSLSIVGGSTYEQYVEVPQEAKRYSGTTRVRRSAQIDRLFGYAAQDDQF